MDAHRNEYLAAAANLADQTPDPFSNIPADDGAALNAFCGADPRPAGTGEPAVGDHVWGTSAGRRWHGRLVQITPRQADVEIDGAWITVDPLDIELWHKEPQDGGDDLR